MAHQKQERPQPCADQPVRLKPLWRLRLGAVAAPGAGADDQPDPGDLDRPRCQLVVIVVFFRHHLELGTTAMIADHRPTLHQLVRVGMERAPMKARPLRPVLVPALGPVRLVALGGRQARVLRRRLAVTLGRELGDLRLERRDPGVRHGQSLDQLLA